MGQGKSGNPVWGGQWVALIIAMAGGAEKKYLRQEASRIWQFIESGCDGEEGRRQGVSEHL